MNSPNAEAAWTTRAPAKINLDLRLRGRRVDGYHLLTTVLQSITLADTLTFRRAPGPFRLTCDTPGVPADARNLAWRGAAAMADAIGMPLDGWSLHIEKHVPFEAGLGGGSADAVAAARLVAHAAGGEVQGAELADIVRPLGADVAFFAWGGTMRGEGVGDDLTTLPDGEPGEVLLVRPAFGVSTRDAYRWHDADQSAGGPALVTHLPSGGVPDSPAGWADMRNDLEAPVVARHPEIGAIVQRLREAGARLAAMSGSGSACFGVFPPGVVPAELETGWKPGTRVWRTRVMSRAEYRDATVCILATTPGV